MMWADIAIVATIAVSAVVSLWRGFLREVLSLAAWIAAFWVAFAFAGAAAKWFDGVVGVQSGRLLLGFLTLFVGTLLVAGVINLVIARLVAKTGLSGTDRMLGLLFGVGRGVVVVAVLVLAAGLVHLPQAPWWQDSFLLPPFERFAVWLVGLLPQDLAANFRYGPG